MDRGFHATVTEQGCERCHMEHHGQEFELVFWGEDGEKSFDHGKTSFRLEGAHSRLECRSCHKESLIRSKDKFVERGKNLDRTFLGLDGSECLACHRDEHRGQFSDRGCESCHGLEKWKENIRFEHDKTSYPLVGRHSQVACGECHTRTSVTDMDGVSASFVKFSGLPYTNCTDCHRDPHERRLGSACQQCHTEQGWKNVGLESFDHSRTRFALIGAHRRTECRSCHPQGLTVRLARFENCTDCHTDHHLGQFARRSQGADCDSCHDIQGFRPAKFALLSHQESSYPLEGAHLAVSCDACHSQLSRPEIQGLLKSQARRGDFKGQSVRRYHFPATECSACHQNPHEESLDRFMLEEDCLACHQIAGWREVEFNHERTDYSLVGAHQRAGCLGCHRVGEPGDKWLGIRFDGVAQDCVACHADPHLGQFAKQGKAAACTQCHSSSEWKSLRFDHNRDSSYLLDGVHERLDCQACHPVQSQGEQVYVRYKPLGKECKDCHISR